MSHFSLLVVTKNGTPEELSKALQPFHEYECTGIDDEFVIDVDVTDEFLKVWQSRKEERWFDKENKIHNPFSKQFYREPTPEEAEKIGRFGGFGSNGKISWASDEWGDGKGYRSKVHMTAEEAGMKSEEVQVSKLYEIKDFAEDWGGYFERDGRFFKHTNPNKKWDWWVVGGRYKKRKKWDWWVVGGRYKERLISVNGFKYNSLLKSDIDLIEMKKKSIRLRHQQIVDFCEQNLINHSELLEVLEAERGIMKIWESLEEPKPRGDAFKQWIKTQGEIGRLVSKITTSPFSIEKPSIKSGQEINQWINEAPALSCFAILKDGDWKEKGEMGWFGMVSGEEEEAEWQFFIDKTLAEIRADEHVTIVDCHI